MERSKSSKALSTQTVIDTCVRTVDIYPGMIAWLENGVKQGERSELAQSEGGILWGLG